MTRATRLATAKPGDSIVIRDEFSEEGDFSLLLDVREANGEIDQQRANEWKAMLSQS